MGMKRTDKELRKIREQIRTGNPGHVMEGVRICREEEEPEILADLVRVLAKDPAPSIRQAILGLISDLRKQNAVPFLVRAIQENPDHPELQAILASCWQSRLVFHEHASWMVDLIIGGDYMVSLEAFTMMENAIGWIAEDILVRELDRLKEHLGEMDPDKQKLVREMMRGLRPPRA